MQKQEIKFPTRVTVDFPEDLYRKLHIHKLDTRESVKDFVIRAVTEQFKREVKR